MKLVNTGSRVSSLLWNKKEKELLSSHLYPVKQLSLWKFLSMGQIASLTDRTSLVSYMAESPDECTVACAGNESLRFWKVFGEHAVPNTATRMANTGPFADCSRCMIR